jgi:hypothetical protein
MRMYLVAISTGVIFLFGCSQVPSMVPPQERQLVGSIGESPLSRAPSCANMVCIYVTNVSSNGVTTYAKHADGNVAPVQTVRGSNTGLHVPQGITLDSSRNIYVANYSSASVTAYAKGSDGNVAPLQTIVGSNTGLVSPEGIALDANSSIYVADSQGGPFTFGSVTVYAAGANGNVAPIRTISGSNTGLNNPEGLVLDAGRELYVASFIGGPRGRGSVTVYSPDANGNVTPIRTINGNHTGLYGPVGIALDKRGDIYIVNYGNQHSPGPGKVTVYAAGANGDVAPINIISGSNTGLIGSLGIALDDRRDIFVANQIGGSSGLGSVTVYAANASGNVAPIRTISGPSTRLRHPAGVAFSM